MLEYLPLNPKQSAACTTRSSTTAATSRLMLLCQHEEIAVQMAHGFAKARRKTRLRHPA